MVLGTRRHSQVDNTEGSYKRHCFAFDPALPLLPCLLLPRPSGRAHIDSRTPSMYRRAAAVALPRARVLGSAAGVSACPASAQTGTQIPTRGRILSTSTSPRLLASRASDLDDPRLRSLGRQIADDYAALRDDYGTRTFLPPKGRIVAKKDDRRVERN
jgi:hypothetical protein